MPIHLSPSPSATQELFRLRRTGVVDGAWHLGFVVGFLVAGIAAFGGLMSGLDGSPAVAMLRYIILIFLGGIVTGIVGAGIGHLIATIWERIDLRRNPRRFET